MICWRQFDPRDEVSFLAIYCVLLLSFRSYAQQAKPNAATSSPACKVADFDTRVQFVNGPGDYYATAFNFRNISGHSCVLDGSLYGPTFMPDRVPGGKPFTTCYDCEKRLPNGMSPVVPPLALQPDDLAHLSFRWKTAPPDGTVQCLKPTAMVGPVLVNAPELLKQVCSDVEVSRYGPGPFPGFAPEDEDLNDGGKTRVFKLMTDNSTYFERQPFYLHVSLARNRFQTAPEEGVCPKLYLLQRDPDGGTRLDATVPAAFKGCSQFELGAEPGDWQSGFDLSALELEPGERTFEVLQENASSDDGRIRFVHSNIVHLQIIDPSTAPCEWGPKVKGVAVDVTLDKEIFRLGEDVPLHVALENFDADVPIYGFQPIWDPCSVIAIEVLDAAGKTLATDERFPQSSLCMGHGRILPYPKGELFPLETTLKSEGWLPKRTGTFTVVVKWSPAQGSEAKDGRFPRVSRKPYAITRASATIRIVGRD